MNSQVNILEGTNQPKKWWQSSNFWTDVIMIAAVVFIGFPTEAGISSVAAVFALVAGGKAIREWLKTGPQPNWKDALNNSNFWNYLATIAVAIVPGLPVELIDSTQQVAENLINGNWQGAIVAGFSLITILYNIFKKSPTTIPATSS